jgi:hypothetical protein
VSSTSSQAGVAHEYGCCQPIAPAHDRGHERAQARHAHTAKPHLKLQAIRRVSQALSRHGDGRRHSPVPAAPFAESVAPRRECSKQEPGKPATESPPVRTRPMTRPITWPISAPSTSRHATRDAEQRCYQSRQEPPTVVFRCTGQRPTGDEVSEPALRRRATSIAPSVGAAAYLACFRCVDSG